MDIRQMHVALDQEFNRLNSMLYDDLMPEHKDYFLNKAIANYVQNYVSKLNIRQKGFEADLRRSHDLHSLVTPPTVFTPYYVRDNIQAVPKPSNSLYITSKEARIAYDCSGLYTSENKSKIYYAVIDFIIPTSINDLSNFDIISAGVSIFTDTQKTYLSSFDPVADRQAFIDYLLSVLSDDWGFEYKNNLYLENHLFVSSTQGFSAGYKLTWDGSNFTSFTEITQDYNTLNHQGGSSKIVPINEAQLDDIASLQIDPFNKTDHTEVLSFEANNYIYMYFNSEFVVKELILSYIRKPKLVSYAANISSDLPANKHYEIVEMAKQMIKAELGIQTYEIGENENLKTE